jgi:hypothetical protein
MLVKYYKKSFKEIGTWKCWRNSESLVDSGISLTEILVGLLSKLMVLAVIPPPRARGQLPRPLP